MNEEIILSYVVAGVEMQTITTIENLDAKVDEIGFENIISITSGSI